MKTIDENTKITLTFSQLKKLVRESESDPRWNRVRAKVEEVVRNLDNGSKIMDELDDTLGCRIGNMRTYTTNMYGVKELMQKYRGGELGRDELIEKMTEVVYKDGKDYVPRTEDTIYIEEFECEHDGDLEDMQYQLEDAGAEVVKMRADYEDETGYAFFKVKDKNVARFEEEFGELRGFRMVRPKNG